jgi:DNA-binding MarR family transcriptional regulator
MLKQTAIFQRGDVRRLSIVLVAAIAMILPRFSTKNGPKPRPRSIPALLATLCPARPRRRLTTAPAPGISQSNAGDDRRSALNSLRAVLRVVRLAGHDTQRRAGLSPAQLLALKALDGPESIRLNELARRTMTSASSVSEVITRLVTQGLVSRTRCDDDGRSVRLALTESGRAAILEAPEPEDEVLCGLDKLAAGERKQLSELLNRLLENISPAPGAAGETEAATDSSADPLAEAPVIAQA